ncbi:hypothetical protein GGR57DRAFT_509178 [Xylariaceae sp. FL1272]|nr:hypothetical protein GGR57DRAFT_509178 [Xylariaceae sp. FL1272]
MAPDGPRVRGRLAILAARRGGIMARLKPGERSAFKAPATAEDCIALLVRTQRRKSKLERILTLLRPAIDPLERLQSAIDIVVQSHIDKSQQDAKRARVERQTHSRGKIQRWLAPSNVEDDLQKHLDDLFEGSCEWLLKSVEFESFTSEKAKEQCVLGIEGLPGSGKSTITVEVIRHLRSRGCSVTFFFFKSNHEEKETLTACLRAVLSQLLRLDPNLYALVEPLIAKPFFIIIDALDESAQQSETLRFLSRINELSANARIMLTSRPPLNFLHFGETHCFHVHIAKANSLGIEEYIKHRIGRNSNLHNTTLGAKVISRVSQAANGLWLYARLMMDDIDRSLSANQILRQLATLPAGFTELYTRMLRAKEASFTPTELKLARQLHLWLQVSDYLPHVSNGVGETINYHVLALVCEYTNDGDSVFDPSKRHGRLRHSSKS